MNKEIEIQFGLQECSKCEYNIRCEECVYNEKDISELIKFEQQQARKETVEKFVKELKERFFPFKLDDNLTKEFVIRNINTVAKFNGVEIKE